MLIRQFHNDSDAESDGSDESPISSMKRDLIIYDRYKNLEYKTLVKTLIKD